VFFNKGKGGGKPETRGRKGKLKERGKAKKKRAQKGGVVEIGALQTIVRNSIRMVGEGKRE